MLVIERKKGQKIMINDDIVIVVSSVDRSGGKVKLAFDAPKDYAIHREEIYDLIQKEKESLE